MTHPAVFREDSGTERIQSLVPITTVEEIRYPRFVAVSIGTGAANVMDRFLEVLQTKGNFSKDFKLIVADTYAQTLDKRSENPDIKTFLIGRNLCMGRGARSKPEIGLNAFLETENDLLQEIFPEKPEDYPDMVYVFTCAGNGTGGGGTKALVNAIKNRVKDKGQMEVAVFTTIINPSPRGNMEGPKQLSNARTLIEEFRSEPLTHVVFENDAAYALTEPGATFEDDLKTIDTTMVNNLFETAKLFAGSTRIDPSDYMEWINDRNQPVKVAQAVFSTEGEWKLNIDAAVESLYNDPLHRFSFPAQTMFASINGVITSCQLEYLCTKLQNKMFGVLKQEGAEEKIISHPDAYFKKNTDCNIFDKDDASKIQVSVILSQANEDERKWLKTQYTETAQAGASDGTKTKQSRSVYNAPTRSFNSLADLLAAAETNDPCALSALKEPNLSKLQRRVVQVTPSQAKLPVLNFRLEGESWPKVVMANLPSLGRLHRKSQGQFFSDSFIKKLLEGVLAELSLRGHYLDRYLENGTLKVEFDEKMTVQDLENMRTGKGSNMQKDVVLYNYKKEETVYKWMETRLLLQEIFGAAVFKDWLKPKDPTTAEKLTKIKEGFGGFFSKRNTATVSLTAPLSEIAPTPQAPPRQIAPMPIVPQIALPAAQTNQPGPLDEIHAVLEQPQNGKVSNPIAGDLIN